MTPAETLKQRLKLADDTALMNWLQCHGKISDNAIDLSDAFDGDLENAIKDL